MTNRNENEDEALKGLPNGVALSWGIVKQGKRGPKGELSIKQIVDAAVAIADRDGLQAVSMSRVAQSLGYTTMSLYRYITSKDDLLLLMQEAVSDVPIPAADSGQHWRDGLREYVGLCVRVFVDHPWYGDIPITGIPVTPNIMAMIDWVLRTLRPLQLDDFEKMSILLLLSSYARSIGLIQRDMAKAMRAGKSAEDFGGLSFSPALKQLVKPERFPDLYPVVMSGIYAGEREAESTVGNDLDFGLERVLDGVESYLERRQRPPGDTPAP
ncbi:TetR/AcrR family transcriptional regulator [Paenibacillus sacheonensis]|uniref:TetR family transcriptional regulator n=1 Tax=Paenibacillus sacheonensis TaxID=742054 RepID=A0A7X4YSS9_9BACL|nr:TetR/AcrR family transcriptional regulator [Paenibacillus sacheonensis]MBM7567185.1 AcrR family transcriptional regulator [Paenibacillus sacheonensis]NBC70889.1 TetR family transcriptional regulator [Paenibacillus sacheonensis]